MENIILIQICNLMAGCKISFYIPKVIWNLIIHMCSKLSNNPYPDLFLSQPRGHWGSELHSRRFCYLPMRSWMVLFPWQRLISPLSERFCTSTSPPRNPGPRHSRILHMWNWSEATCPRLSNNKLNHNPKSIILQIWALVCIISNQMF